MSRNFHLAHVFAPTKQSRARVVRAVLAYAKRAGFEQVTRVSQADRVIRIGGRAPWLSIEDDGYEIGSIVPAVASAVPGPVLEAYCEASAIVWLGMLANGRRVGGWGPPFARRPPARVVDPILVTGDAKSFATAWDEGIRQTFPETALAVAAKHVGMTVDRMIGDTAPRGTTLALRRKRAAWKPEYVKGAPSFDVGWGSNQGWGPSHLVFEEQVEKHRLQIRSTGGAGRGLSVRFIGSAIERGHVEVVKVEHAGKSFARAGDAWVAPDAKISAGLVASPNVFELGRREADKARAIENATEFWLDVEYRGVKDGACELTAVVETDGGRGTGTLDLRVMWRPWRPASALDHVGDHALFGMHRCEHVHAHITLRGSLAEAWSWARPHLEAWAAAHDETLLRASRAHDVVLAENLFESDRLSYDKVVDHVPADATVPFQVTGRTFLFGTFAYEPYDSKEPLVVQLVLGARSPDENNRAQLSLLSKIADEAIASGVAYSALVSSHTSMPSEKTAWEEISAPSEDPLKLARWHATHLRGVDKRMWLSAEHAAQIDRAAVARHATVTTVGAGLRIDVEDDRPRRTLAPLEELLAPLLPSRQSMEAWQRPAA